MAPAGRRHRDRQAARARRARRRAGADRRRAVHPARLHQRRVRRRCCCSRPRARACAGCSSATSRAGSSGEWRASRGRILLRRRIDGDATSSSRASADERRRRCRCGRSRSAISTAPRGASRGSRIRASPASSPLGSAQDAVTVEAHLDPDDESGWVAPARLRRRAERVSGGRGCRRPARRVRCGLPGARRDHRRGDGARRRLPGPTGRSRRHRGARQVRVRHGTCAPGSTPRTGLSVVALRPRKARGQDADVVSAVALEPEGQLAIEDPRLSTTYAGDGRPLRVGLELWVSAGDDDEEQYPRRASGETLGVAATGAPGALRRACAVRALGQPLRRRCRRVCARAAVMTRVR